VLANLIADTVADDGGNDHHGDDGHDVDVAQTGSNATDHRRSLSRYHETDEERVLSEHERPDHEIHPEGGHVEETLDQAAHGPSMPTTTVH
jgi:hypothetical protein